MALKEIMARVNSWLRAQRLFRLTESPPPIDSEGLLSIDAGSAQPAVDEQSAQGNQVVVKAVQARDKAESLEKLQDGFNNLITQLQGINENLGRQVAQHQDLISRVDKMPKFLESFPAVIENQNRLTEQLLEQLRAAAAKDQQFIDTVEKIPTETAKQTDALVDINHQLGAAADTDVQMAESFNKFNQTLSKLDQSTVSQTDSIIQMGKTFATSDRYLKFIVSRQHKRFVWMFVSTISVCVFVILILTAIIIYLKH